MMAIRNSILGEQGLWNAILAFLPTVLLRWIQMKQFYKSHELLRMSRELSEHGRKKMNDTAEAASPMFE